MGPIGGKSFSKLFTALTRSARENIGDFLFATNEYLIALENLGDDYPGALNHGLKPATKCPRLLESLRKAGTYIK